MELAPFQPAQYLHGLVGIGQFILHSRQAIIGRFFLPLCALISTRQKGTNSVVTRRVFKSQNGF